MDPLDLPICRTARWQAAGQDPTTVLAKLSELLFVEAVRHYVEDLPADQTGWLAGLRDPMVARALALMHGDIARPWSVDELGRAAGMSRSALAERFSRLIGMAPMHYLAHWRMQIAAQKLREHRALPWRRSPSWSVTNPRRRFRARSRKPSAVRRRRGGAPPGRRSRQLPG